ncbi:MAG: hypothetical protein AAGA60_23025 [Cyanobacteria bacterium P01_E01_bin.42]
MQVSEITWSQTERNIVREVLQRAYDRETKALIQVVREQAGQITELQDLWKLHDFLSARRFDLDGKYDDRDSEIIFVFATLLKEGWLQLDELQGLEQDKISKISALSRM